MASVVGTERPISSAALAEALKGLVWGWEFEDVKYDIEFLGKLSTDGDQIVRVKRKQDKQRKP